MPSELFQQIRDATLEVGLRHAGQVEPDAVGVRERVMEPSESIVEAMLHAHFSVGIADALAAEVARA